MVKDWKQEDITSGDMTVHYVRTGGNKPPLVLAHGFSDNGLCWLPLAEALSADYDVIMPDARGHGLSSRVRADQELDLPADLAMFIRTMHLDRPIVGGHSMGASTAAALAARYPDLVRALVLEDPAWRNDPEAHKTQIKPQDEPNPWLDWLKGIKTQPIEAVMAQGRMDNPGWPEIEMRAWAESKQQLDLNFLAARQKSERSDWRIVARAITVPTLLITADPDLGAIVTPEAAEEAEDMNPHIQAAHITGVGHSIRRENFPAYLAAVQAFLAEL